MSLLEITVKECFAVANHIGYNNKRIIIKFNIEHSILEEIKMAKSIVKFIAAIMVIALVCAFAFLGLQGL